MADVAAGAALGAERSSSPAVGMNGAAPPAPSAAARDATQPAQPPGAPTAEPATPDAHEPAVPADHHAPGPAMPAATVNGGPEPSISPGCTQAQLRRFIKSRPYVPMHELRRRFELNGAADEVSPIRVADGTVYVGLGARESDFIAELVRQGDIGVELCHDPPVPMVVGVYAMRPISR